VFLRKVLYILGQLSDTDVDWLANMGQRIQVVKGTELIKFGVEISNLYIVLEGELSIQTNKGFELAKISSGEILGEMSLVDSRPPSASVLVLQDATLLELDKVVLQKKLDMDTGFSSRFYRSIAIFLSERMRSLVGQMGYGDPSDETSSDLGELDPDELDANVLDNVHLAGARFERLLAKLMK
jgi:CRP/FNR family cyclic AMP-dependent transcriptional regulator